ncbi:MAG: acetyl-CoA carboxylase biotin carboxylase subunit, partial [Deltaproteobacteria bacterium]|nr:acetyl-CoA carboxylase biotin carboxylase subunit [Deltaproteobacteria bacterium]
SRHIEVQVLSDHFGNAVHLGERECSIQKRHQKLMEEAPSPFVDAALREKMGDTALAVVRFLGYTNAGTVEFLVAPDGAFYFMEMNARIQVEHPVTEMTTGIDLVCRQIRIASGEALLLSQEKIRPHGWALECRINAEDPDDGFMPSPGTVEELVLPGGAGIRVDTHLYPGYTVPPFYDSLICKVIAWGKDRPSAISRMRRALFEVRTKGIKNTVSFHAKILDHPDFIQGRLHTRFLEEL